MVQQGGKVGGSMGWVEHQGRTVSETVGWVSEGAME